MAPNPLDSALTGHGNLPITLEDFAALVGATPAALRGRRDRDQTFPAAINADASPLAYSLRDLADWWVSSDLANPTSVDPVAMAWWRFTATFEQCSARHGAEATRRLVAGTSLLLCERHLEAFRAPAAELLATLRTHSAGLEPRRPKVAVHPDDFRPDPVPATDRDLMKSLLSWARPVRESSAPTAARRPQIPDDSPIASQLLLDLVGVHRVSRHLGDRDQKLSRRERNRHFVELVEPLVRGLARDISTRPSSSDLGLTRLMVAIAEPQPGEVIVDLACGQGSTFIEAMRTVQPPDRSAQTIGCIGRERDELVWTIAKVRLGLRGIAHDLGGPGDGLTSELEPRPTHRFITDPGMRIPAVRKWARGHLERLDAQSVAIMAVPAAAVFRANPGRWWLEVQDQIDSVVFTPTDLAVIVLRTTAPAWKSLVQIHRMTPAMAERRYRERAESIGAPLDDPVPLDVVDPMIEPFMPAQIDRVIEQIGRRVRERPTDRRPPEGEDDFVQWRSLRAFTLDALGEPRFGDCTAIRDAVPVPEQSDTSPDSRVVAAIGTGEHAGAEHAGASAEGVQAPERGLSTRRDSQGRPIRSRGSFAALREAQRGESPTNNDIPSRIEELTEEAIEAVSFLRWVLDPSTLKEKPMFRGRNSPKTNGALEEFGTEEMRRALRRLELRLLGEETRGRKPTSQDQTGPNDSLQ